MICVFRCFKIKQEICSAYRFPVMDIPLTQTRRPRCLGNRELPHGPWVFSKRLRSPRAMCDLYVHIWQKWLVWSLVCVWTCFNVHDGSCKASWSSCKASWNIMEALFWRSFSSSDSGVKFDVRQPVPRFPTPQRGHVEPRRFFSLRRCSLAGAVQLRQFLEHLELIWAHLDTGIPGS